MSSGDVVSEISTETGPYLNSRPDEFDVKAGTVDASDKAANCGVVSFG